MVTSFGGSGDGGGPSLPSSSSTPPRREQYGMKRGFVEMELNAAARVLADLVGMEVSPEVGTENADGNNGDRDYCESSDSKSKKRSKESPVRAQDRRLQEPNSSKVEKNINHDGDEGYVASQGRTEEGMQVGTKHNHQGINLNITCPACNSSGTGDRAKQKLTEAEKEARRHRRILANRESARQTILRRQTLREELTTRVADLSIENKNMKMEKEHVLREYLSLRDKNQQLKEQIVKTEKTLSVSSSEAESSSSSPSTPQFVSNGKSPFVIPYWLSTAPYGSAAVYAHANPCSSTVAVSFYVPPCAWYYPFDPELPGTYAQNTLSIGDNDRTQAVLHPFLSMRGEDKSDASGRKHETLVTALKNRKENPATSSRVVAERDKEALASSSEDNDMLSMTIGLPLEDNKSETRRATGVQERLQSACTCSPEKFASSSALAEARRRRKELIKLKRLNGR